MSKRKTNKPRKTDAGANGVVKAASTPTRVVSAPVLTGSEGDELQAAPFTETRLPEFPGQQIGKETDSALPPVPPPELEAKPALPLHLAAPKPDVAFHVEARAEAEESVQAAIGKTRTASSPPKVDGPLAETLAGPLGAIAGIEACQTLFMELARDQLDFAASLASMRSPLDMIDVATKFAGRQIGLYGRFSKSVVDIAAGRQAPLT